MLLLKFKNSQVISTLTIFICFEMEIESFPINNGFNIRFSPISVKQDVMKSFGTLFAKIPQELSPNVARKVFSEDVFPRSVDLAKGCTNQIAKILFPTQGSYDGFNDTTLQNQVNFINVPVIAQGENDYKILVVSAPSDVKLGKVEASPLFVYIVFPYEDTNATIDIPSIYFVKKSDGKLNLKSSEKVDPILIIDNNRTVTGLKSKAVSKFVKFKNKLTNRRNVEEN